MNIIVYRAFEKMKKAAQREGISLFIASGYRSYRKQQQLYQNYVNRDGKKSADRYSARP
jgi:D-alanyl-D-alanine carboxypeptidase